MTDDPKATKDAQRLFAQSCGFVLAAALPEHFDSLKVDLPEVAFWGRSNVGKSSLINALTGRGGLARTSRTPGRTQQIIFFNLADRLLLADLPGYGHADAPGREIAQWNKLIRFYLGARPRLRRVLLLVDGRHGLKPKDHEMMTLLDRMAVSYKIVITKADQVKEGERSALWAGLEKGLKKHPAAHPESLLTSAEKGMGIETLRTFLAKMAEEESEKRTLSI